MRALGRPFPGWLPAALTLVAALGCRAPASAADVLLITLDTARADRFSYAGDSPVATPRIDALAAEGTAFLGAVSPAPITLVAHASLLTGLAAAAPEAEAERLELDSETRRQLVELGYLAVAPPPLAAVPERPPSSLPHPRDRVHVVRAQSTLTELFDRGCGGSCARSSRCRPTGC